MLRRITTHLNSWRPSLFVVGVILGSLLFVYQIWRSLDSLLGSIVNITQPILLVEACIMAVLANGLQIVAWSMLMRTLGIYINWPLVVRGYTSSFLPRYIPGTVWGYLSRGQWLHKSHNVPFTISGKASLLETLAVIASNGLVIGVYLIRDTIGLHPIELTVISCLLLLTGCVIIYIVFDRSLRRVTKLPYRLDFHLTKFSIMQWVTIMSLYGVMWLCFGELILKLTQALNIELAGDVIRITPIYCFAWLIGFLMVFVPTGIGVREIALSTLLMTYTGITIGQAGLIAVMSRFSVIVSELIWLTLGPLTALVWSRLRREHV